jgi:hypothetical protein
MKVNGRDEDGKEILAWQTLSQVSKEHSIDAPLVCLELCMWISLTQWIYLNNLIRCECCNLICWSAWIKIGYTR